MQSTRVGVIEGKVAKILNLRELVINRGSEDGVEVQMRFEVVEESQEVLDPDTEEVLGEFRRVKVRVKAAEIYPRFSIARTYETYKEANFAAGLSNITRPRKITKVKTISTSSDAVYEEGKSYVKIGDKIVQVPEF